MAKARLQDEPLRLGLDVPENIASCKPADADNPGYKQVSTNTVASIAIQLLTLVYLLVMQLKKSNARATLPG